MITFCRGLVLRCGERQLEFERDLGDGRVQFKYLDNFEVRTFRLASLYADIVAGRYAPTSVASATDEQPSVPTLPAKWSERQLREVAFRMRFVRAVLCSPLQRRSREHCEAMADQVWAQMKQAETAVADTAGFSCPSGATVELWIRKYQQADRNAYVLLDRRAIAVRPKRLYPFLEVVVDTNISKHYLKLRGPSVKETHRLICRQITRENKLNGTALRPPSERTVNRRVLSIPPYIRDTKRIGPAYARNKWRYSLAGDQSTRIMERVEIDHTLLDIWVLDPRSGVPLGRPWITVLIDRYSGYLLGFYISFYGPSAATVARAMKASIMPKDDWIDSLPSGAMRWTAHGIPELYVVDNGLEFHSDHFMRIAWELRSDVIFNPVRQPWLKASIERAMMEFNRALPAMGKVYRPISNAVAPDPRKGASILFDDLCSCLLEWASQKHPLNIHSKTLCRPLDLWEEGLASRPPPMLPTQLIGMDLLCGLNAQRKVDGDGVFFKYLRFNSVELQDYRRSHGPVFRTEIRYNPDDLRQMHVLLPKSKSWLCVPLQRSSFMDGQCLSLVQLEIARAEAGKRLTRANAYEELEAAMFRLQAMWHDAMRRGVRQRKDSALIRMQALTSAPLGFERPVIAAPSATPTLQLSPAMQRALPEVVPFKTFNLDED
ncbi:transposase family protein [Variovorax sp. N23]|uniref:transposase family protein n=1 Tax=Variovorax sp. N23 TaxID=2980555 RepID=UPI0021C7DCC4|nr:transposase family protein [Variovorax sp. N23]MCU4120998.1 transposase family protein [Variovorax sp. N23]